MMKSHSNLPTLPLPVGEPMPQFFVQKNDEAIRVVAVVDPNTQIYLRAELPADGKTYSYTIQRYELNTHDWFVLKNGWIPTTAADFLETLGLIARHSAKAYSTFSDKWKG